MKHFIPISLAVLATLSLGFFEWYLIPLKTWHVYPVLSVNGLVLLYMLIQRPRIALLDEFKSDTIKYQVNGVIWAYIGFISFLRFYPLWRGQDNWYLQLTGLFLFMLTFYGIHVCMNIYSSFNAIEGSEQEEENEKDRKIENLENDLVKGLDALEKLQDINDELLKKSESLVDNKQTLQFHLQEQKNISNKLNEDRKSALDQLHTLKADLQKSIIQNGNYYYLEHKDPGGNRPFKLTTRKPEVRKVS